MSGFAANQRINQALMMLTKVLQPYVERRLREVYGDKWRYNLSLAVRRRSVESAGRLRSA